MTKLFRPACPQSLRRGQRAEGEDQRIQFLVVPQLREVEPDRGGVQMPAGIHGVQQPRHATLQDALNPGLVCRWRKNSWLLRAELFLARPML